ncbi:hypothetical protein JNUCC1_02014 [Lentibacillus sp. JNUCC-1]|uniref:hypothetical protein n=1 Tax=Lentibacillus sp. JNUCC-1 TaxID=2654513 RepID=UPI0012E88E88|nr:hypothetical protein [Lentibacillus sp. JNUCC-1]MUV38183.1 hypothetical protein [Lentibacillus sp. JNUCC-1]
MGALSVIFGIVIVMLLLYSILPAPFGWIVMGLIALVALSWWLYEGRKKTAQQTKSQHPEEGSFDEQKLTIETKRQEERFDNRRK